MVAKKISSNDENLNKGETSKNRRLRARWSTECSISTSTCTIDDNNNDEKKKPLNQFVMDTVTLRYFDGSWYSFIVQD